jgi:hypothetical protein
MLDSSFKEYKIKKMGIISKIKMKVLVNVMDRNVEFYIYKI